MDPFQARQVALECLEDDFKFVNACQYPQTWEQITQQLFSAIGWDSNMVRAHYFSIVIQRGWMSYGQVQQFYYFAAPGCAFFSLLLPPANRSEGPLIG